MRILPRRPWHHARPFIGTARRDATVILLMVIAIGGATPARFDSLHAQPADGAGDPFARELHPLRGLAGDLPAPAPPPVAPAPARRAAAQLPIPFPEAASAPQPSTGPTAPAVPSDDAETYLRRALEARRRGDLEASVELCSRGLAANPDHPELLLRRGIAWFHLGMFGIATEDFADAAAIAYDDPRPELWRGLTAVERDRGLEAVSAYSEAIRRDRTYLLAYLNRGLAYLQAGEAEKAERDFDHAIRHDPRDVRAWFHRGVAATRQRRFGDAVRSYETALRIDPEHEPSRRNLQAIRRPGIMPDASSSR
jgi:tetratricopeptide (TPR) repeat protein